MKVVYVAHALSGDREGNREKAAKWVANLAMRFDIAPIADWIILSGQWDEGARALGLSIDCALIEKCNEVWLVGESISKGMLVEVVHATKQGILVHDFTGMSIHEIAREVGEPS